ncbi:uncharacterized protein LOC122860087 [Aphidius gifuensis]|uniref:uncharacterized protein LOC122860087 n=1 Tax=Aphidius gifuensis TaxID=684658 RepID=UPI001CDCDB51|nr:uncharacterized protein LOC122860087 [Aphidius gifuensis]
MPPITEKLKDLSKKNIDLPDIDHKLFEKMSVDLTINFKDLYNILKDDKFSLNRNCHIKQELDDTVNSELELLAISALVPQRKLSHLTISKIILIIQEVIEKYGEQDFPGYIKPGSIKGLLRITGYSININTVNVIYRLFKNADGLIHFNDFFLIVLAIKNNIETWK